MLHPKKSFGTFFSLFAVALWMACADDVTKQSGIDKKSVRSQEITVAGGETFTYDIAHRMKTYENARGDQVEFFYDGMGRVTQVKNLKSGQNITSFTYDAVGNRLSMLDGSQTVATTYTYDDLNRLTSVQTPQGYKLQYEYDAADRTTAILHPNGDRIEYTYDAADRLVALHNVTNSLKLTYLYNRAGQLVWVNRPSSVRTQYQHDDLGRVSLIRHSTGSEVTNPDSVDPGTNIAQYQYSYDVLNRVTSLEIKRPGKTRTVSYQYDPAGNLSMVVYANDEVLGTLPNRRVVAYTYDDRGNRLSLLEIHAGTTTKDLSYAYAGNKLVSIRDNLRNDVVASYEYDASGNRTKKTAGTSITTYTYDWRNQLTEVNVNGTKTTYAYNGDGHRIKINNTYLVNNPRMRYYDIVEKRDATSGEVLASFSRGVNGLAFENSDGIKIPLRDLLGSTRELVDDKGASIDSYDYDVYGSLGAGDSGSTVYLYAGQHRDSSGLIFMRARYYDPDIGRFVTKDPTGLNGDENPYVYAQNAPVAAADPSGLSTVDFIEIGADPEVQTALGDAKNFMGIVQNVNFVTGVAQGMSLEELTVLSRNPIASPAVGTLSFAVNAATFSTDAQNVSNALEQAQQTGSFFDDAAATLDAFALSTVPFGLTLTIVPEPGALPAAVGTAGLAAKAGAEGLRFADDSLSAVDSVQASGSSVIQFALNSDQGAFGPNSCISCPVLSPSGHNIFSTSSTQSTFSSSSANNFAGPPAPPGSAAPDPGGVLIDKAATLLGTDLSSVRGASYDPVSGEIIFLGDGAPTPVEGIDVDYFYTALQSVFGSAVPPLVSLDPPVRLSGGWFGVEPNDLDPSFAPGELAGFSFRYDPIWVAEDDIIEIRVQLTPNSPPHTIVLRAEPDPSIIAGDRLFMKLTYDSALSDVEEAGIDVVDLSFTQLRLQGNFKQISEWDLVLKNSTNTVKQYGDITLIPDRQHRRFGGRVESTRVGWVMYEADRIMKCLAIGSCDRAGILTEPRTLETYDSSTVNVNDYDNVVNRIVDLCEMDSSNCSGDAVNGNMRMWFAVNTMQLKRHVDDNGRSTVMWEDASVALLTESLLFGGGSSPPAAQDFVAHFTEHYDEFADRSFWVADPDDPSQAIQVRIFDELRKVMQAVALARFLRDNNIPVDMWWLNGYQPTLATSPKSIPTMMDERFGVLIHGGVDINIEVDYLDESADAQAFADSIQESRVDVAKSDIDQQIFAVGTNQARAIQSEGIEQSGNRKLVEEDLSFASTAGSLTFVRSYNSSHRRDDHAIGAGWRHGAVILEFARPSIVDETNYLLDNNGFEIWRDGNHDTHLRIGKVRVVSLLSGNKIEFESTFDVLANPSTDDGQPNLLAVGLNENNLPNFFPVGRSDGSSLQQRERGGGYDLTRPNGTVLHFAVDGNLRSIRDAAGNEQLSSYDDAGRLTSISDGEQIISVVYQDGVVTSVEGPSVAGSAGNERITYAYTGNNLTQVNNELTGTVVDYTYESGRLVAKFVDGEIVLDDNSGCSDDKNRTCSTQLYGNVWDLTFDRDNTTGESSTTVDWTPATGAQLQWTHRFDAQGRYRGFIDANGASWDLVWSNPDAILPSGLSSPIPGVEDVAFSYTPEGMLQSISNPNNVEGASDRTIEWIKDGDPSSFVGKPWAIVDENGHRTELEYDLESGTNDLIKIRRFGDNPIEFDIAHTRNEGTHSITVTNPLGNATTYLFDDKNQLISTKLPGTDATTYTYDERGRLRTVQVPSITGAFTYDYDNRDRIIRITQPNGAKSTFSYYGGTERIESVVDPMARVKTYTYDANGRVKESIVPGSGVSSLLTTSYTYNPFGNVEHVTLPGGMSMEYIYDQFGRLVEIAQSCPGGDCDDACPQDPSKTDPGVCGCGVSDQDNNNDGSPDCVDPNAPNDMNTGMDAKSAYGKSSAATLLVAPIEGVGELTYEERDEYDQFKVYVETRQKLTATLETPTQETGIEFFLYGPGILKQEEYNVGPVTTLEWVATSPGFIHILIDADSAKDSGQYRLKIDLEDIPEETIPDVDSGSYVYFSGTAVNRVDINTQEHSAVYAQYLLDQNEGMSGAMEISVDHDNQDIYFVQNRQRSPYYPHLFRANLDVGNQELLFILEEFGCCRSGIKDIAVDSINQAVYVAGYRNNQGGLWRYNLDGTSFVQLTGIAPTHFALDAHNDHIYWIEGSPFDEYRIKRSTLAGTNIQTLYTVAPEKAGAANFAKIALDIPNRRIYWRNGNALQSGSFDGTSAYTTEFFHEQLLAISVGGQPRQVYVTLYNRSENTSSVARVTDGTATVVYSRKGHIDQIDIY